MSKKKENKNKNVEENKLSNLIIKEIPSLPGYFASSCGKIFQNKKEKKYRPGGYKKQYLRIQSNRKDYYVHRLILETFVGKCPDGFQACHNDGNPINNNIGNLRWDTPLNNSRDKKAHGTNGVGQLNAMAKITDSEALLIVKLYPLVKSSYLRDMFKVTYVSAIATGIARFNPDLEKYYATNKEVAKLRSVSNVRKI